jgi:hypothetical protein
MQPLVPIDVRFEEVSGDLFQKVEKASIAHVSKDFKMNAGIALEFKIRFKKVGRLLSQNKGIGQVAFIKQSPNCEYYVLYLVTKKNFHDKPTYTDLQLALEQARDLCHELKIKE